MSVSTSTPSTTERPRRAPKLLPEIQALRAFAVVAVLVFHVWPHQLSGGYIGVDAFFVISGYLITSHLAREYDRSGHISLSKFWARRIRRLLPSAFVVLAACVVALFVLLPSVLLKEGLRQIAASAVYGLNWVLAFDAVDYLAAENSATLVQHYWTLGVEEQFYLGWPLVLLAGLALSAKFLRGSGHRTAIAVAWAAGLVGLASFVFSLFETARNPAFTFFNTGARVWEFAVGALLAALLLRSPDKVETFRRLPVLRLGLLPLLGFGMLTWACFTFDASVPFPGTAALVPVIGAALVILGGHLPGSWWTALMSISPVQYLGKISYEIYLWHWPLVVGFLALAGHHPTKWSGTVIVLASIVLAAMLNFGVDKWTNLVGRWWQRRGPAYAFAALGAIVFVAISVITSTSLDRRAAEVAVAQEAAASDPASCLGANATLGPNAENCVDRFALTSDVDLGAAAQDLNTTDWCLTWFDQDWLSCEGGELDNPVKTIALVGDSHAASLKPAFVEYMKAHGIKVITYMRYGCTGETHQTDGVDPGTAAGQTQLACVTWSERARAEIIARDDIDAVVFTSNAVSYIDDGRVSPDDILQTWQEINDSGKPVVVIRGVPQTNGTPTPECLAAAGPSESPCATERAVSLKPTLQEQVLPSYDGDVQIVDMSPAYCDDTTCHAVIGSVVVYADVNHISGTWARSLMNYLGPALETAMS